MSAGPAGEIIDAAPRRRPMRADALKNRQRILEAAAEVFAAQGVAVPIDLVAERAGVGVGTLYRHFPTKEALFEAIVTIKVADLALATQQAARDEDPGRSLFGFIGLLAAEAADKQDLFDALDGAGVDVKMRCAGTIEQLEAGIDHLLARAAAAGAVRDDVGADDVIGVVIGTCHSARRMGGGPETMERLLGIFCEGLRASP
ncbi:MAG: TetR/AcrR family transcriptional regulator [Acidimicrobiales bacterium]